LHSNTSKEDNNEMKEGKTNVTEAQSGCIADAAKQLLAGSARAWCSAGSPAFTAAHSTNCAAMSISSRLAPDPVVSTLGSGDGDGETAAAAGAAAAACFFFMQLRPPPKQMSRKMMMITMMMATPVAQQQQPQQ
jgi:hypothetical protein